MRFDAAAVLVNARAASTEDLLDRVTVYRDGMEAEALELFEMELYRRGVTASQIADHGQRAAGCLRDASGMALSCSRCRKPAVTRVWSWHWLWGKAPLFPKPVRYCEDHRPDQPTSRTVR